MLNLAKYLKRYLEQEEAEDAAKAAKDAAKDSEKSKLMLSELEKILKKNADNKLAETGPEEEAKTKESPSPKMQNDTATPKMVKPEDKATIAKLSKDLKALGFGKQVSVLKKKYGASQ